MFFLNSFNIEGQIENIFLNHLCYADDVFNKFIICWYAETFGYVQSMLLIILQLIMQNTLFHFVSYFRHSNLVDLNCIMDNLRIINASECKYLGKIICQKNCDLDTKKQM